MKFFSFFNSDKITPVWQFSAHYTLWRLMFSKNGLIVGEDRNIDSKTVEFFCLESTTGRVRWNQRTFDEQWWIGLDAITDERLYLHGFRKPDMPEHKNIIAVDIRTGNVLWRNTDCTFLALQSPFIYGYKDLFERRVYYKVDEQTGSILEELSVLPSEVEPNTQHEKTDFSFPEQCSEHDLAEWKELLTLDGFTYAEAIRTERYAIVNVYTRHSNPQDGLKNSLSIIDTTTKKKVYSDVVNALTPYPVPDSFFLDIDRVYYIKERKTFVAVDLKT